MVLYDRMIMAMVVFALATMLPNVVSAKVHLAGSDRTKTLDCGGSSARIAGSNNKVTLTGGCTALTILGSRNTVTAALAHGASIWFVGSKNEVIWTTPDGKEPRIHHLGVGNALKKGEE